MIDCNIDSNLLVLGDIHSGMLNANSSSDSVTKSKPSTIYSGYSLVSNSDCIILFTACSVKFLSRTFPSESSPSSWYNISLWFLEYNLSTSVFIASSSGPVSLSVVVSKPVTPFTNSLTLLEKVLLKTFSFILLIPLPMISFHICEPMMMLSFIPSTMCFDILSGTSNCIRKLLLDNSEVARPSGPVTAPVSGFTCIKSSKSL